MPEQDKSNPFASRLAPTGRLARLRRLRLREPALQARFRAWVNAAAGSVEPRREQARSHRPPGPASETPAVGACLAGEGSARSALASIPLPQRGLSTDSLLHGWDGLRRCAACLRVRSGSCGRFAPLHRSLSPSPIVTTRKARPAARKVAPRPKHFVTGGMDCAAASPRLAFAYTQVAAVASLACIDPSPPAWPLHRLVASRVGWTAPLLRRGLPSLTLG